MWSSAAPGRSCHYGPRLWGGGGLGMAPKEGLLRGNKSAGRGPATFLAKGVLERLVGRTAVKFMCGGQGLRTQRGVAWGFWNSQDI